MDSMLVSMPTFDLQDRYIPLSGTRLSRSGRDFLRDYRQAFGGTYCRHACNACTSSCPEKLPVGTILRYANYFEFHGRQKLAMLKYRGLAGHDGSLCLGCDGPCASACPYGVSIQASLLHAHSLLTLA
jgi:ferredoxin